MHERVYRALLRLLPSAFRHEFGASMAEDFSDQRGDAAARGGSRVRALWMTTTGGVMRLATREHLGAIRRDVRHAVRLFSSSAGVCCRLMYQPSLTQGPTMLLSGLEWERCRINSLNKF